MRYLDRELKEYSKTEFYPFHMPGHKRQMLAENLENPYAVDITEITGFDNLHHAEGILKEQQEFAAALYNAEQTYFLINGSTAGILAGISACTSLKGKILMARNCHKAAYHAAYLRGLEVVYVYPTAERFCGLNGGILPEDVENALKKQPEIEAVFLTSPTYDGMVSDIKSIAEIVHGYGIPLLVDEAHGAHFAFHNYFPVSALEVGADAVIQSIHKTLPSFTQTAVLHIQTDRISKERIEEFLDIYQTSSPSYVLMGGMSACFRYLEEKGKAAFSEFTQNLELCRQSLRGMKHLALIGEQEKGKRGIFDVDKSKLLISTARTSVNGPWLQRELGERYHLELEMAAEKYVLALTSVMDQKEGFDRLCKALLEIDSKLGSRETLVFGRADENKSGQSDEKGIKCENNIFFQKQKSHQVKPETDAVLTITEAMESELEWTELSKSEGRISGEYAYLYPPGIPLLVPGERINRSFLEQAAHWKQQGIYLQGLKDYMQEKLLTVKKNKACKNERSF